MKCKNCKFYDACKRDCENPLVRGKSGLIHVWYCEDFSISKNFGCIFFEPKTKKNNMFSQPLNHQVQRPEKAPGKAHG